MRWEPSPAEVRSLVLRTVRQFTSLLIAAEELCETVRFSQFGSPGRCYQTATMWAEWISDEGIVRFFDETGTLVHSINLWCHRSPQRAAA